ncbi:MAG TPA: hypothetical protein VIJ14_08530 [Rhabdochlamydiaceae bacterium]
MSIRVATRVPVMRPCINMICRFYSQDSRISGKAVLKDLVSRIFSKPTPRPDAPKYEVLKNKAACDARADQDWDKGLKKASEEFKKVTEKKS